MKLILTSVDEPLAAAWETHCGEFASVHRGSILDCECDAVVSPANSFGFMDGGIDLIYSRFFGWHVQERLQELIRAKHHGELLVGAAEIVATDHPRIPWLIAAPTMRVPMILSESVHPYLAARAVFLLARQRPEIRTVAMPGLGTGVGQVAPETCARQVRAAIEDVVLGRTPFPASWDEAQERHQRLYTDKPRDLQY